MENAYRRNPTKPVSEVRGRAITYGTRMLNGWIEKHDNVQPPPMSAEYEAERKQ